MWNLEYLPEAFLHIQSNPCTDPMHILLVTQYFHPENFKSNDAAFELARRGHKVTVLTGLPNYPHGKVYDGYGLFRKRKEVIDGVTIYRTLVIPRGNGGGMMLALNYLSWAFIASFWAVFMAIFGRYEAVLVHETSPITQGFPALIVKWIRRIPMYFWVLDLWPESLQAAAGINNRHVLGFFSRVATLMYRNSEKILISSKGFKKSICEKGDFESRIEYFPNWAEDVFTDAVDVELPPMPAGFKVMFAGNVGEAQDFDAVMNAALELKDSGVKMMIVGDGRKKAWVEDFIVKNALEDVVFLMGRHPLESMPSFFASADVLFLALKNEYIFSLTAPAKLQAYMASGKPVLSMIDGEAAELVRESGCGLFCPAGDHKAFASCVLQLRDMHPDELRSMGQAGKRYFKENFSKDKCMEHLCSVIE